MGGGSQVCRVASGQRVGGDCYRTPPQCWSRVHPTLQAQGDGPLPAHHGPRGLEVAVGPQGPCAPASVQTGHEARGRLPQDPGLGSGGATARVRASADPPVLFEQCLRTQLRGHIALLLERGCPPSLSSGLTLAPQ